MSHKILRLFIVKVSVLGYFLLLMYDYNYICNIYLHTMVYNSALNSNLTDFL